MVKKNVGIIILVLAGLILTLLFQPVQALLGYDEFTDDSNITISETVENELGQTCTNCNVSMWLNYPNGSLRNFSLMKYNTTSTKYDSKKLIPYLVNGNTTRYTIRLTANRTSSHKFNGTSDRTIITVYDIYPVVDSMWDVGLIIMLLAMQWTFVFLAYKFYDDHIIIKYGFFAIALFFNSWLMALGHRILVINGIFTNNFSRLFESSEILAIVVNYIFTMYIFVYLLYQIIHNIRSSSEKLNRLLWRRNR